MRSVPGRPFGNLARRLLLVCALPLLVVGCARFTTGGATPTAAALPEQPRDPARIIVTENDITDRRYVVVGDIQVSVRKTMIFNRDPTRDDVNESLRREAAALGADAVILARYGTLGVDLFSYGRLDGNGRAVRFTD